MPLAVGSSFKRFFASAVIRTAFEPTPQVVVSFTAHPFEGGLHQIYDFAYIESTLDRELSRILAWSVRESIMQKFATKRGA